MGSSQRKICAELTTKEIMEKHGIKNESRIKTWMKSIDLINQSANSITSVMVPILPAKTTNFGCQVLTQFR